MVVNHIVSFEQLRSRQNVAKIDSGVPRLCIQALTSAAQFRHEDLGIEAVGWSGVGNRSAARS